MRPKRSPIEAAYCKEGLVPRPDCIASIEMISLASSCADMLVLSFARTIHMSRNCLKVSLFTGSDDKFISRVQWAARSNSFDCSLMVGHPSGQIWTQLYRFHTPSPNCEIMDRNSPARQRPESR